MNDRSMIRAVETRVVERCRAQVWQAAKRADEGSGTVLGLVLLMVVGLVLCAVLIAGALLSAHAQGKTASDQAALSAALYFQAHDAEDADGKSLVARACEIASEVIRDNHCIILDCSLQGEDIVVKAYAQPMLSFLPRVTTQSRAGPRECVARNG